MLFHKLFPHPDRTFTDRIPNKEPHDHPSHLQLHSLS